MTHSPPALHRAAVLDDVYPGMWRVRWPDGTLSDMVNRTRAEDAVAAPAVQAIDSLQ